MKLIEEYTLKELHMAVLETKRNRKRHPQSDDEIEEYLRRIGGIEVLPFNGVATLITGEF